MKPAAGPKRRALIPAFVAFLIGALTGGGGLWLLLRYTHQTSGLAASAVKQLYQCPMHPTITSDHPGDCPICGMKLVPVPSATGVGDVPLQPPKRRIAFYRSPMNPNQTSPVPAKDEMGMDYLPVYEDELGGEGAGVPGLATVVIDPSRQQIIGLRTAKVTRGPVGGSFRTVGTIEVDPRRVRRIHVKVEGFVEKIYLDFVGKPVRRGDPLFSLYSPSLLQAQNEYLLALETRETLAAGGTTVSEHVSALAEAGRQKLELWDVPKSELRRLERTGRPQKTITFYSPLSGVVTAKNIVQGSYVTPGDTPYEITDLGEVWVMADAYESELGLVRLGMPVALTLQAYPNRSFSGRVVFIDPLINPATRTLKVHLHFLNPSGELMPGMFGEVTLQGLTREALRIPFDAVVRSGSRDVVFVALGEGKFAPREIRLGRRDGELIEVVSGLQEGEEVVTRATFLVDSESRLRASLAAFGE